MFEELVYDTRICRKTKNDLICIAPPEDVDQTVFRNNLETLTKEMDQDIDIKSELLDFIYQDFSVPEK
ncbi:hypothetical protein SDC9_203701 [bioreactor metagenome]|uniref:Uncharacterized protein n=1 Tax=bioreactor metagenome TaxID=1076179 RepID=A0A645IXW6_9ZZZZ